MAVSNETFTWKRPGAAESDEDVWDDRLLIDAYEKASRQVSAALTGAKGHGGDNQEVKTVLRSSESSASGETKRNNRNRKASGWKVGHFCRSIYREDGIEYEGQLTKVNNHKGTCIVRYIGYNNEEQQDLASLKKTWGNDARKKQTEEAELLDVDSELDLESPAAAAIPEVSTSSDERLDESVNTRKRVIPPPPPPSVFPDVSGLADDEVLSSMLMSWYMSGYHTGYYKAHKQFKTHCNCKATHDLK